jgi:hypothetical protein
MLETATVMVCLTIYEIGVLTDSNEKREALQLLTELEYVARAMMQTRRDQELVNLVERCLNQLELWKSAQENS